MVDKIRIAMIGCGRFSQFFGPLFKAHPAVDEVYVCDLKKERAEEYAKRFDVSIISSFEEALASDRINAVAIFTQRFQHGSMVIEALKAGKHVYVEKPLAETPQECEKVVKAEKESGKKLLVGMKKQRIKETNGLNTI